MKIQHLRHATMLLSLGPHHIVVDPMLSERGAMPSFRPLSRKRRRNPYVALPPQASDVLARATAALVTHEHPDHFDRAGLDWVRQRELPVWTSPLDAPSLNRKGIAVQALADGAMGMRVEVVRSRHGRGLMGWLMGPVHGYFLAHPDEPSVYLTSDTVLTAEVSEAVERLRPDVVVAPAGGANLGIGGTIMFTVDELVALAKLAPGDVVFNHLEAMDHCAVTRDALRQRMASEGVDGRVHVPADGQTLELTRRWSEGAVVVAEPKPARPGLQKWLTARFSGT